MLRGEYVHVIHDLAPLYDENSQILILGSLPSVKSRGQFFYNHPQNRFWKVIAAVTQQPVPETFDEKKRLILENGLALWDVIAECDIIGSGDSSIRNVRPNDLTVILDKAQIRKICVNGSTAGRLYKKYIYPQTGIEAVTLPSTSPANAAWSLENLIASWRQIME